MSQIRASARSARGRGLLHGCSWARSEVAGLRTAGLFVKAGCSWVCPRLPEEDTVRSFVVVNAGFASFRPRVCIGTVALKDHPRNLSPFGKGRWLGPTSDKEAS